MRARPVLLPLLVLVLFAAACGGGDGDAAVDEAIENLQMPPDALDADEAACVVDSIGEENLAMFENFSVEFREAFVESDPSDFENEEEMQELLSQAVSDCLGDLSTTGADDDAAADSTSDQSPQEIIDSIDCSDVDGPCDYGDDDELDALWDSCEEGDGEACDDLFFQSGFDTRYEAFGDTCGARQPPGGICPGDE